MFLFWLLSTSNLCHNWILIKHYKRKTWMKHAHINCMQLENIIFISRRWCLNSLWCVIFSGDACQSLSALKLRPLQAHAHLRTLLRATPTSQQHPINNHNSLHSDVRHNTEENMQFSMTHLCFSYVSEIDIFDNFHDRSSLKLTIN